MKKLTLLLTAFVLTGLSASAAQPLILEPLSPAVVNGTQVSSSPVTEASRAEISGTVPNVSGGAYEATYIPVRNTDPNMVPQNAAAEGKPVPKKRTPRVRIQTKQNSQGNSYWNAGGKGTKSFF